MEWLLELLKNDTFVWGAMAVIIFAFTQALKLPIKHFTAKIEGDRARKIANISILLLAFGVAVLLDFLFAYFYLKEGVDLLRVARNWTGSSAVYSIIERFLGKKVENPMNTDEGKTVVDLVEDVTEDGKIDDNDKHAVKDFWDRVKHG
jgi:hypothetical protein